MSQITEGKILQTLAGERTIEKHICVSDILEEVKEDMCDNYCKYQELLDDESIDAVCSNCPLMRL